METGITADRQLRETVAEEVRALLARRRLNGAKLAAAIDRSEMYVSRRLRGETAFDLDDLDRIARVLDVEVVDLLPRPSEGRTVTFAGARETSRRQVTERIHPVTVQPSPPGHPNRSQARSKTRRPAIVPTAHR